MSIYCRCGHPAGTHFAEIKNGEGTIRTHSPTMAGVWLSGERVLFEAYRCHGMNCSCRLLVEDRSRMRHFKRWLGKFLRV